MFEGFAQDAPNHGTSGLIHISKGGYETNVGEAFVEAARGYFPDKQAATDTSDFMTSDRYGVSVVYSIVSGRLDSYCYFVVAEMEQVRMLSVGSPRCSSLIRTCRYIDRKTGHRSDTAHSYIYNLSGIENVDVLADRHVARVIMECGFSPFSQD